VVLFLPRVQGIASKVGNDEDKGVPDEKTRKGVQ